MMTMWQVIIYVLVCLCIVVITPLAIMSYLPVMTWPWVVWGAMIAWMVSAKLAAPQRDVFFALSAMGIVCIVLVIGWRTYIPHRLIDFKLRRVEIFSTGQLAESTITLLAEPLAVVVDPAQVERVAQFVTRGRIAGGLIKSSEKYRIGLCDDSSSTAACHYFYASDEYFTDRQGNRGKDIYMPYASGLGALLDELVQEANDTLP